MSCDKPLRVYASQLSNSKSSSAARRCPPAWWVTVPGVNFELGENLSPLAEQGIEIAIDKINHLIKTARKEKKVAKDCICRFILETGR
jgi:hypothetical protein